MEITLHQHELLTNIFEKNPDPDFNQQAVMGELVGLDICDVHCWFNRCHDLGPEALWAKLSLEIKKTEEQKKKEGEEAIKKLSQAEAKITSQAAEIQKLESWITNLTTSSHNQQSDPARLLNMDKELARLPSKLEEAELKKENERLKEQKKELEAMLQSRKKLEEQVENGRKENEKLSKIIADKNAEIQNLKKTSVKDQVNAQQVQAANLTANIQKSLSARQLIVEAEDKKKLKTILQLAQLQKENESLRNAEKEAEQKIKKLLRENEMLSYDLLSAGGKVAQLQAGILKSKEEEDAKIQKVEELMGLLEKEVEKLTRAQDQEQNRVVSDDKESEDEFDGESEELENESEDESEDESEHKSEDESEDEEEKRAGRF